MVNENSRIDHLEYAWLAVIDDRIHLACHTLNEDKTIIKYNRYAVNKIRGILDLSINTIVFNRID